MKVFGSAIKLHRVQILTQTAACGVMFLLHILGVLQTSPMLFFICIGVTAVGIGVGYIPEEVLKIECMDYEIYKNGKDRSALCNAVNKFVIKVQTAVATALVGAILVAAGYVVDSVTDTYLGELSSIPPMLNWFVVIMGLIPCILGVIAWLVLKQYPVTAEIRAAMKEKLSK
jgi:Na+/melibiose symporter-like transporter